MLRVSRTVQETHAILWTFYGTLYLKNHNVGYNQH